MYFVRDIPQGRLKASDVRRSDLRPPAPRIHQPLSDAGAAAGPPSPGSAAGGRARDTHCGFACGSWRTPTCSPGSQRWPSFAPVNVMYS